MTSAKTVTAGIVIIGDEVLSGRTQDVNVQQIASFLSPFGISVREVRIISDDQPAIVEAVQALSARHTYVFTTGGLGPTHDDITADAIAAAFGRSIDVREDAKAILDEWYDRAEAEITPARLRMARIPEGGILIDNPVTGAPGFQVENVFVMAGVPSIAKGMLQDVAHRLEHGAITHSVSVRLEGAREGDMAAALGELQKSYPDISIGSYPWFKDLGTDTFTRGVELVARGTDQEELAVVEAQLRKFASE